LSAEFCGLSPLVTSKPKFVLLKNLTNYFLFVRLNGWRFCQLLYQVLRIQLH
jgi:hypothetical protein